MTGVFALPAVPGWRWAPEWPPRPPQPAPMLQCLVLAALLHALLILLFGSVTGGTARPGEGVWGQINVTLRGLPDPGSTKAPPEEALNGPVGSARERRFGGAVRDEQQAPRTNDGPGAARQGLWSSSRTEQAEQVAPGAQARAHEAPPATVPAAATPAAPAAALTRPGPGLAPAQEGLPSTSAPETQAAAETRSVSANDAGAPSRSERIAPRRAESRPTETPRAAPTETESRLKMVQSTPVPAAAAALPSLAPPLDAPGVAAPAPLLREVPNVPRALALPSLPSLPTSAPRSVERLALPAIGGASLPALDAPPQTPSAQVAAPVELRALPALAARGLPDSARLDAPVPAIEAAPALSPLPNVPASALAVPAAAPSPAAAPAPLASPGPAATASAAAAAAPSPAAAPAAAGSAPAATAAAPAPAPAPATAPAPRGAATLAGAPDAGSRVGRDAATPAAQPPSAPKLNLDLARPRGGEIAPQNSRSVLNLIPPPPGRKSKLAQDIEEAAKKDCRTAYAGFGLLAPLAVAADVARDKTCKW